MVLLANFTYHDRGQRDWTAEEGYRIDGASIPRALWTTVGSPYTGMYRRASIVHDKACDEANGNSAKRRAADRMFYRACRDGGCGIVQAKILYIGVRIGAWTRAAGMIETLESREPRVEETDDDRALQAWLKAIAEDADVNAAPDDADDIERAVDGAAGRFVPAAVLAAE